MTPQNVIFLLLSVIASGSIAESRRHHHSLHFRQHESAKKTEQNFDYLLLAQFWPSTSCIYFENQGKGCTIPAPVHGWTIHGLWPAIPHTEKPDYCNDSMKFDYDQIKSLATNLTANWPYYCSEGPKTDLWDHEWSKHGTCAQSLPVLQGELNYFSQTLRMHSKLNTLNALAASGVTPSETKQYAPEAIFDALKKAYGKIPDVTCAFDEKTKTHHLEQIWLCFTKQFELQDCPGVSVSRTNEQPSNTLFFKKYMRANGFFEGCPEKGDVFYKPIPKN